MLFPFEWNHPYSWRTNLRGVLPPPFWWCVPKGEDCEAAGANHVWYNQDDIFSACYHCRVLREGKLWLEARVARVKSIVIEDLEACDVEQTAAFNKYAVEPYLAPIVRYGKMESVVVVARNGSEIIYWEDIEGGFNLSPVDSNDQILEHWCNQDGLGVALNAWIDGRGQSGRFGPARAIDKLT
jgi:hypothetical protein